jgi:hypothetical protein
MNLGQTMITIGMFVLLVMSVISANRMLLENTEASYAAEALSAAATIAQDLLHESMSKRFDANSDDSGTQDTTAFSLPAALGPSAAERTAVGTLPDSSYTGSFKSIGAYGDFDDYKGYSRLVAASNIGGYFSVSATVYYVNESAPDVATGYRTFYKVIAVTVSHPLYLTKPITLTGMLSY